MSEIKEMEIIEEVIPPKGLPRKIEEIKRDYTLSDASDSNLPLNQPDNVTRNRTKEEQRQAEDLRLLTQFQKDCINAQYAGTYDNVIGKRISHLLEVQEMTIVDLSKKSGIDRTSIHRYINNGDIPRPKTMLKLADALDCDVDAFSYDINVPYEDWEDDIDKDYRLRIDWTDITMPYKDLKEYVLGAVRMDLTDEEGKRIPKKYRLQLQQQMIFAFDTLEMLMDAYKK